MGAYYHRARIFSSGTKIQRAQQEHLDEFSRFRQNPFIVSFLKRKLVQAAPYSIVHTTFSAACSNPAQAEFPLIAEPP
ncbi:MAG: hypothetical protein ACTTKL_02220 [Treponema sp.]